jgi:Ca2+-binding EF-hand superfamily protein
VQIFIAPSGEPFRAPADAPYPVADWFARADANHDGKLTEREFTADFLRFFASLDLDHDGQIDGGELERYETATPELRTGGFGGVLGGSGSSGDDGGESRPARRVGSYMGANDPQGAGRFDLLRIPEPVASMDTDLKGRISRAQAEDAAAYRFSLLDVQHHGYLLLSDLPQTFAQQHHSVDGGHGHGKGGRHGEWHHGGGGHGDGGFARGGGDGN